MILPLKSIGLDLFLVLFFNQWFQDVYSSSFLLKYLRNYHNSKSYLFFGYHLLKIFTRNCCSFPNPKAVAQTCSIKSVFLEILQSSQENICARVSFLIKLALAQMFSCKFCEISKNTFSYRTTLVAFSYPKCPLDFRDVYWP